MNRIYNTLLRCFVRAQVAGEAPSTPVSTRRRHIGAGALVGWVTFSTSSAFAGTTTAGATGSGAATGSLQKIVGQVSTLGIILIGAAVVVVGVYGALQHATAMGNEGRARQARRTFTHLAIGIAAAAAIYVARDIVLNLVSAGGGSGTSTLVKGLQTDSNQIKIN